MFHICIFEDEKYAAFFPLTVNRPIYDLLLGIDSLYNKIRRHFPKSTITLHSRPELKPLLKQSHPGISVNNINMGASCLFLNGRVVLTAALYQKLTELDLQHNWLLMANGQVIAAYLTDQNLGTMINLLNGVPKNETIIVSLRAQCMCQEFEQAIIVENMWDLVHKNAPLIKDEFNHLDCQGIIKGGIYNFNCIYNENNVYIEHGAFVEANTVLNAQHGPIYIDKNAYIEANTRLEGPLYIGENTRIMGGKISTSSIGPNCKVRGEVSNSIFLGFTNKAHDGFIGHSYLGEWVNLGAMTTNSNLKNTYGEIELDFGETKQKTGQQFLGAFIGDYTKTAIGTLLNTGTIVGFGVTLLGTSIHEKYVPSFAFGL